MKRQKPGVLHQGTKLLFTFKTNGAWGPGRVVAFFDWGHGELCWELSVLSLMVNSKPFETRGYGRVIYMHAEASARLVYLSFSRMRGRQGER